MRHSTCLRVSLATSALLAATACSGEAPTHQSVGVGGGAAAAASSDDPAVAARAIFTNLADRRISRFMRTALPPAEWDEMERAWNEARKQPLTAKDEEQFQQFMGLMLSEDAEDTLFAMVAPRLEKAQEQLQGFAMMLPMVAAGAMEGAVDSDRTSALVGALGEKITSLEITSEEKARAAIRAVIAMAEGLELEAASDVQALDFEGVLEKADVIYAGVADVLDVYGLSLDETFRSVKVETTSIDGDTASLSMSIELFGSERQTVPFEMERVGGRWTVKKDDGADEIRAEHERMAR